MPGSMSDFAEGKVADALLGGSALGAPATWYVGLFTVMPNEDGTGGTEAAWTGYARVAVTNNLTNWPAYASGLKANGTDFTFAAAGSGPTTVVGYGLWDAASAGNLWFFGALVGAAKIFEADGTTDVFNCPAHGFVLDDTVRLRASVGGTLPTGVTENTTYYARDITTDSFKLSATQGGAAINITTSGSGIVAKLTAQTVASGNIAKFVANALKFYFF